MTRDEGTGCWTSLPRLRTELLDPGEILLDGQCAENRIERDLNGFLSHFSKSYFGDPQGRPGGGGPGYLSLTLELMGSYMFTSHREILQAAVRYADMLPLSSLPASDPTGW